MDSDDHEAQAEDTEAVLMHQSQGVKGSPTTGQVNAPKRVVSGDFPTKTPGKQPPYRPNKRQRT